MLVLLYGAVLLIFGISLTAAFAGIRFSKRNCLVFFGLFVFSGLLQAVAITALSEKAVWMLYPLITHLPLILMLWLGYRKTLATSMAATFTAYLCCQPSKWLGVLVYALSGSIVAESIARMICMIPVGYVALTYVASCLSDIFNKDRRSVWIFGIVPAFYYAFDYVTAVYTDLWMNSDRVVMEMMPLTLTVAYVIFCFVYYKEYEQKADALRKEQIVRITVEQQSKEIVAVKESEREIRLLRHDMRMFLSGLAVSIENGETEKAQELIATHIAHIEGTRLERFCHVDTLNYVLSDYAEKCRNAQIPFTYAVELEALPVDEVYFSSIVSNALDNALNAQMKIPAERRNIKLLLKNSGGKLLFSVKNPVSGPVVFADGLPVSDKKGHGYGTQSIRYLTERLGGNCQFTVQDGVFVLRVVL